MEFSEAVARYAPGGPGNPTEAELIVLGSIVWRAERLTNHARAMATTIISLRLSPSPYFPFGEVFEKSDWRTILDWIDKGIEQFDPQPDWTDSYLDWKKRFRVAIQRKRDVVAHADFQEVVSIKITPTGQETSPPRRQFVSSRKGRAPEDANASIYAYADEMVRLENDSEELLTRIFEWRQEIVVRRWPPDEPL